MNSTEKEKIDQIIQLRNKAHAFYSSRSKVYKAFTGMEQSTYIDGVLKKKEKELIAIGISVTMNCESCMEWHIKQALDDGATQEEIIEVIEVGIEMSGGPGTVAARFAMNVLEYYMGK